MPLGIEGLLICCFVCVALGCWAAALRRWVSGQRLLAHEPRRVVPWGLFDVMLAIFAWLILQGLAVGFVQRAQLATTGSPLTAVPPATQLDLLFVGSLAWLGAVALSLLSVHTRAGADWSDVGWDRRRVRADMQLGLLAFVMLAPPVFAIQWVLVKWFPSQHPLIEVIRQQAGLHAWLCSGFAAIVVAPLAEEYFFRVLLQGWLERLFAAEGNWRALLACGDFHRPAADAVAASAFASVPTTASDSRPADGNPYASPLTPCVEPSDSAYANHLAEANGVNEKPSVWPIAISAALFAALHASHGPDPIPLFLLAAGLGYLYQRTHRILPCIVVHFLLNSFSLAMLVIDILAK